MADITPIASLNGELAMPEKVWMQGPPGPQGQQGEPGAAATVTVGTVTTGEPGTDAIVTNSGTESAAVLDFTIPRGATGAAGAPGPQGPKGDTGETGPAGAGVPDGGTVGQLLSKTESGTAWIDPPQSGDGVTTLHINVTAVNMETMEATFTADKTPTEMQQASANGPTWCVVTFAAGIMAEEATSLGVPPAWSASIPAFGDAFMRYHDDKGYNIHTYAVLADYPNSWILNLGVFGS